MNLSLQDLQEDLKAAGRELLKYESKYGVHSASFHECFMAGLIEDCGNFDFQTWAGWCETKLALERRIIQQSVLE
jgi:hypothetical protein